MEGPEGPSMSVPIYYVVLAGSGGLGGSGSDPFEPFEPWARAKTISWRQSPSRAWHVMSYYDTLQNLSAHGSNNDNNEVLIVSDPTAC
jgi:hypothetical protein